MYTPLNYEQINIFESMHTPNTVLPYNNEIFDFWCRSLFQRASSVIEFNLPKEWQGDIKDFFIFCLFARGYVVVFDHDTYGTIFQPCNLSGQTVYYQPTTVQISNPAFNESLMLELNKEAELIKLTPDYMGITDIVVYYAEKLASLDSAVNMSIINSKFAYLVGAKNKNAAQTIKKMFDKINQGEPAVFFDSTLANDANDKSEPWQFLERTNIKQSYITTDLLQDFQTILNNFDSEVGIPTIPYQKKERLVTTEAESRTIDSTSRSIVWMETLTSSLEKVNKMFNLNISAKLRYNIEEKEGAEDGKANSNRDE